MKTFSFRSGTALALLLAALLNFTSSLCAQSATDLNEGVRLDRDAGTGAYSLKWWGKHARVYLPESSPDLLIWTAVPSTVATVPTADVGEGAALGLSLSTVASRHFLRLRFSDDPDYDHDGLTNLEELQLRTNAATADSDADGIPDSWEITHGLDPNIATDAAGKPTGGTKTFRELYNDEKDMLGRADAVKTLPTGVQLVVRTAAGGFCSVTSTGTIAAINPP